jgi:hypothetical protein
VGVRALGEDAEDDVATDNGLSVEMTDTMFEALKQWRTVETGSKRGFTLMNNDRLLKIVMANPHKLEDLDRVTGVSKQHAKKYGPRILAVLQMCRDGTSLPEIVATVEAQKAGTVPRQPMTNPGSSLLAQAGLDDDLECVAAAGGGGGGGGGGLRTQGYNSGGPTAAYTPASGNDLVRPGVTASGALWECSMCHQRVPMTLRSCDRCGAPNSGGGGGGGGGGGAWRKRPAGKQQEAGAWPPPTGWQQQQQQQQQWGGGGGGGGGVPNRFGAPVAVAAQAWAQPVASGTHCGPPNSQQCEKRADGALQTRAREP